MSKLKGICPLCQEEIKEGEKEYRFRFGDEHYWVHDRCAHPKNEQLERIERMLKYLIVRRKENEYPFRDGNTYHVAKYREALPDISDILDLIEKSK